MRGRPSGAHAAGASMPKKILLIENDSAFAGQLAESLEASGFDVRVASSKGYNVAVWRQDEIVYSLVSDLDEDSLFQLVQAAQQQSDQAGP